MPFPLRIRCTQIPYTIQITAVAPTIINRTITNERAVFTTTKCHNCDRGLVIILRGPSPVLWLSDHEETLTDIEKFSLLIMQNTSKLKSSSHDANIARFSFSNVTRHLTSHRITLSVCDAPSLAARTLASTTAVMRVRTSRGAAHELLNLDLPMSPLVSAGSPPGSRRCEEVNP